MRAFKTNFVTKKTIKKQTGTHEIFFSHQHKYAEVFISDISKSMLFPLFWRISQSSGQINKTIKNHAVDYHSCAFRINLEYTPLIFQCPRRALSLPNFIEFSFKPVYRSIGEFFKFSMFRLLENAFFSQKNWI